MNFNQQNNSVMYPNVKNFATPQAIAKAPPVVTEKKKMTPELFKIIEKRNQNILKYILEMKYLKPDQLKSRFFGFAKDKAEIYMKTALEKLTSLKFIKTSKQGLLLATPEAEKYLVPLAEGKTIAKPISRVWDPEVRHDLMLVDMRMRFEELGFISKWFSENAMRTSDFLTGQFTDLPDALVIKKNGRGYFLELEISRKGNQRYADRLIEYKKVLNEQVIKDEKIDGVMFLCYDPNVAEVIHKIAKDLDVRVAIKLVSDYLEVKPNEL